jgi:hypothetical protein
MNDQPVAFQQSGVDRCGKPQVPHDRPVHLLVIHADRLAIRSVDQYPGVAVMYNRRAAGITTSWCTTAHARPRAPAVPLAFELSRLRVRDSCRAPSRRHSVRSQSLAAALGWQA